jgi:hypothetical protein
MTDRTRLETTYETVTVGAVQLRRKVVEVVPAEPVRLPPVAAQSAAESPAVTPAESTKTSNETDELATASVVPDPRAEEAI